MTSWLLNDRDEEYGGMPSAHFFAVSNRSWKVLSCSYSTVQYHNSIIVTYCVPVRRPSSNERSHLVLSSQLACCRHRPCGSSSLSAAKENGANQCDCGGNITWGRVRPLCALHRHYDGLGIGSTSTTVLYCTVQYGELGGNDLSSSEEDDVMEGRRVR